MTTYPLSEPATIILINAGGNVPPEALERGTLEECAGIVADLPPEKQRSVAIQMDDINLRFGPQDVDELLRYLRNEEPDLTNNQIAAIKS